MQQRARIEGHYSYPVYDHDSMAQDILDLESMGYHVDTTWNDQILSRHKGQLYGLHLHINSEDFTVQLHTHSILTERVPNFMYIVNELPTNPNKGN